MISAEEARGIMNGFIAGFKLDFVESQIYDAIENGRFEVNCGLIPKNIKRKLTNLGYTISTINYGNPKITNDILSWKEDKS